MELDVGSWLQWLLLRLLMLLLSEHLISIRHITNKLQVRDRTSPLYILILHPPQSFRNKMFSPIECTTIPRVHILILSIEHEAASIVHTPHRIFIFKMVLLYIVHILKYKLLFASTSLNQYEILPEKLFVVLLWSYDTVLAPGNVSNLHFLIITLHWNRKLHKMDAIGTKGRSGRIRCTLNYC